MRICIPKVRRNTVLALIADALASLRHNCFLCFPTHLLDLGLCIHNLYLLSSYIHLLIYFACYLNKGLWDGGSCVDFILTYEPIALMVFANKIFHYKSAFWLVCLFLLIAAETAKKRHAVALKRKLSKRAFYQFIAGVPKKVISMFKAATDSLFFA